VRHDYWLPRDTHGDDVMREAARRLRAALSAEPPPSSVVNLVNALALSPPVPIMSTQALDEYDEYDLSLTANDLAALDAATAAAQAVADSAAPATSTAPPDNNTGGQHVNSTALSTANKNPVKSPTSWSSGSRRYSTRTRSKATGQKSHPSPYNKFRAWRKTLSVSDLVGPVWYATL
jgi:hypothetical protein